MKVKGTLFCFAILTAFLAAGSGGKTMYVHHSNGVDPIFFAEIDSIRFSSIGLDSLNLPLPTVQEIWTPDSVYRYNTADVDSVTFGALPPIAVPEAIDLAGELGDYIEKIEYSDYDLRINLSPETPDKLRPSDGALLYRIEPCDIMPDGVAVRVLYSYDNTLYCEDVDLSEIFTRLTWDNTVDIEFEDEEIVAKASPKAGTADQVPWLAAKNDYPDLISGAITMTDELRDIPAGPEHGKIDSKIRVQPIIRFSAGAYILPGMKTMQQRTHLSVKANVEAEANGRCITEGEFKIGSDKKITQSRSLGLGQKYSVVFNGTLTVKGKIGLDYKFAASYLSTVSNTLTPETDELAIFESRTTHKVLREPNHELDASMDGKLGLSASITVTAVNLADSVKSISSTVAYGSTLSGSALFLNSDLEKAKTDNVLYQRITATGIKAQPVESVTASAKYSSISFKSKSTVKPSPAVTFYAVPKFGYPQRDPADNSVMFETSGVCMKGRDSSMGTAVKNSKNEFEFVESSAVWPASSIVRSEKGIKLEEGENLYPTVTLNDTRILAAPSYPTVANNIYPVISTGESGNVRITSGIPIIGTASTSSTIVTVGNIFPCPKNKD